MSMDNTIKILEALASSFSPTTGELIEEQSVLRDPMVIRALKDAIYELKKLNSETEQTIKIEKEEIEKIMQVFREQKIQITARRLSNFFIGKLELENEEIKSNTFYEKYKNSYDFNQLLPYFKQLLLEQKRLKIEEETPWKNVDFFEREKFNNLSESAVKQLQEKIAALAEDKMINPSGYKFKARKNHPRAFAAWSSHEKELLKKAMQYTNDLEILSQCFKRGKKSIQSYGEKLIYYAEMQEANDDIEK